MDDSTTRHLIVMRHGERIDDNVHEKHKQILPSYDPELTLKGIKQAKSIGQQFMESINDETVSFIKLYASPFTRTIQTGIAMTKAILNATVDLEINEGLSELFGIGQFQSDPIPNLLYNNKKRKEYGQFFGSLKDNKAMNVAYKKNDLLKYPESFDESIDRYKQCAREIMETIMNSHEELTVIVTHGYGVLALNEVFSNGKVDETLIDFCSSFLYSITNKSLAYIDMINPY